MSTKNFYTIGGALLLIVFLHVSVCSALVDRSISATSSKAGTAQNIIIGVSPYFQKNFCNVLEKAILGWIIRAVPSGSRVRMFDGYNNNLITDFQIPSNRAFYHPNVRAKYLRSNLLKIVNFFKKQNALPGNNKNLIGCIKTPQFLEFVSEAAIDEDLSTTVVLLGSPLYVDNEEKIFSMLDGYFPSDGHLCANQQKTVYGVSDKTGFLDGVIVHYGYIGNPWDNDAHKYQVKRFWTLFVQLQGGELATFAPDLETTIDRVIKQKKMTLKRFKLDSTDSKIEMHVIKRKNPWLVSDTQKIEKSVPKERSGSLKIGIRWNCGKCDLDLYSKPSDTAAELYFRNPRTDEGLHFKDFQRFSSPVNGFEYVEYEKPVDLFKTNASINFYSGSSAGGVEGHIRVFFKDKVYQKKFKIEAHEGNRGADSRSRNTSRYWKIFNIAELIGLSDDIGGAVARQSEQKKTHPPRITKDPTPALKMADARSESQSREVRILSPIDGATIFPSRAEQMPVERPVEGDVLGFSQTEIAQFGLIVEISIYTSRWYPQGLVRVQPDGSWLLNTAYFGGSMHRIKARLKDKHGNIIASSTIGVPLIR